MSAIFGHLNVSDSERVFQATVGQRLIFEAATNWIAQRNAELDEVLALFVERTTSDYKFRYKLPAGGYLQERAPDGRLGTVKQYGYWDVALPLRDYGAQVGGNDVDMAYMTIQELDLHLQTVNTQNVNTVRHEVLKALLNNTQDSFSDPLWGTLAVEPLANGDSVVYPPVLGSVTEATDDHYLESGYAAANISDTNDPYVTIVDEIEEHFGAGTGGENIAVLINNAQRAKTEDLTDFEPVPDRFVRPGANISVPMGYERLARIGRVIGRHNHGCWVVEWRFMPANYMQGIHLDAPAPLIRRIDPEDTNLWQGGLHLVAEDAEFPFKGSMWRNRFGIGAGNRLNGVVMELGTGGTYSIPSGYS